MSKRITDMTSGSPAKHILGLAVPLILTNMGQQLYMIADGAIVGRGVGVKALAAVGATDWCYWLVLWTVGGLAQGFSTFVSRAFGEKFNRLNEIQAFRFLDKGYRISSDSATEAVKHFFGRRNAEGRCLFTMERTQSRKIGACTL